MAAKLKVLLLAKVPRVGAKHDVIEVRKGFAMNYLVPQGLAKRATKQDIASMEAKQKVEDARRKEQDAKAVEVRAKLEEMPAFELSMKVTAKGGLYGRVTEKEVAELIAKQSGQEITADMVEFGEQIKTPGEHAIALRLTDVVVAKLKINVIPA